MQRKILHYYGGKTFMIPDIVKAVSPLWSAGKMKCFVDVFGGSGNVLLNIPDEWKLNRVYNDIDSNLIALIRVLVNDEERERLFRRLEYTVRSRELFEQFVEEGYVGNDFEDAFRYLYRNMNSYSADMKTYGVGINIFYNVPTQTKNNLREYARFMSSWNVEHLDYRELFKKYDGENTFFYLDPPYLKGGKTYAHIFDIGDFWNLKDALDRLKGSWLMNESEVDFPDMIKIFGEPRFVSEYRNNVTAKDMSIVRKEGYWSNFDLGVVNGRPTE